MSRHVYAQPPTRRPLHEFAIQHLSPQHVTMNTPSASGWLDSPEGGELLVGWRGLRIHIRLDRTGYSAEILAVARYYSLDSKHCESPALAGARLACARQKRGLGRRCSSTRRRRSTTRSRCCSVCLTSSTRRRRRALAGGGNHKCPVMSTPRRRRCARCMSLPRNICRRRM